MRFAQTGRVDEAQRPAADVDHRFDRVASGAGNIGDDRPPLSDQCVEERRLSGIGNAGENDERSFADELSGVGGREELVERVSQ